jgi:predicted hydrocarbon binding protein
MTEKTVSNMVIRFVMDAIEEVMGLNGLKAVLNYGGLIHLLENKPDYSYDKNYTDDEYGAMTHNLFKVVGIQGGKALLRLVGKASGKSIIEKGVFDSLKELPEKEKFSKMMEIFVMATGRGEYKQVDGVIMYDNPNCSACRGITDKGPVCTPISGMFDEFIRWAGLEGFRTVETKCKAKGDDTCRYEILPVE